uniref:(California timema) hypothetical protein n=1 Tax=Timema californicum TaxID=61474 RepID=A0A7R9J8G9_TIMCA|nr:unnamed protein product [Timema californicum]
MKNGNKKEWHLLKIHDRYEFVPRRLSRQPSPPSALIRSNTDAKPKALIGLESTPKPPPPLKDCTCKNRSLCRKAPPNLTNVHTIAITCELGLGFGQTDKRASKRASDWVATLASERPHQWRNGTLHSIAFDWEIKVRRLSELKLLARALSRLRARSLARSTVYYASIPSCDQTTHIDTDKYPSKLGITIELCAGIVDKELPLEEIASIEILEECGYDVPASKLETITTYRQKKNPDPTGNEIVDVAENCASMNSIYESASSSRSSLLHNI